MSDDTTRRPFIELPRQAKDIANERFGRLIALGPIAKTANGIMVWLCKCDCGNTASVQISNLRNGHTQSCGCLQSEHAALANTRHGKSKDRLYRIWHHIIERTTNAQNATYPRYGGRGIRIYEGWHTSFVAFHDYVTKLPDYGREGHTLDRIDNNGNYEPGNVRWTTAKEQARNTRKMVTLTFEGKAQCISAWAEELNINSESLRDRLKNGWSIERVLTTPIRTKR